MRVREQERHRKRGRESHIARERERERGGHLLWTHLLQLLLPSCSVTAVVGGGRGQVLQDVGVSFVAQGGQVADVEFQLAAVLIEF